MTAPSTTERKETESLLSVQGLEVRYGPVPVLRAIDLEVTSGEIVALVGANGAGKTTALHAISGAVPVQSGRVVWKGLDTKAALHRRAAMGMALVPEGRSVFSHMTCRENLRLGKGGVEGAVAIFPELSRLLGRKAGLLSGGEQQMLSLARALASQPSLLLVDELSFGLSPVAVGRLFDSLAKAAGAGMGILIVEQHVERVLEIAHRVVVLRRGRVVLSADAADLRGRGSELQDLYLAGSRSEEPN
jgi:branched-chain amino acid transport system ATP-binding protein